MTRVSPCARARLTIDAKRGMPRLLELGDLLEQIVLRKERDEETAILEGLV